MPYTSISRRAWLKRCGILAAATAFPYLLPSGRLFAQTGSQLAAHVVVVILGKGIRWQEAVGKGYLRLSQYAANPVPENDISGNIMPNLWAGDAPTQKIVYGIDPPDIATGGQYGSLLVTPVVQQALQTQGITFGAMQTPHNDYFESLGALLTGNNANSTTANPQRPSLPTIFEYVRRYMGASPLKTWWIGKGIEQGVPLLNHSQHSDFGAAWGANFMAPDVLWSNKGATYWGNNQATSHPYIAEMSQFLDRQFLPPSPLPDIGNSLDDRYQIASFVQYLHQKGSAAVNAPIPEAMRNADTQQISYTCELLRYFQPTLSVVQLSEADIAHTNFTQYLRSLYRADYAIAYLWQYIQTQIAPMANNTCLLVISDFGRNTSPNNQTDTNAWRGYDHDDTDNSLRSFALLLCPNLSPTNLSIGTSDNPLGDNRHVALTIAEVLGIKTEVANAGYVFSGQSLIDFM
ncbi:MAG: hypothetical protein IT273_12145 [Chitinophagales bacterium]|nr:hypothetical protein [Chitinophagales bacterium]